MRAIVIGCILLLLFTACRGGHVTQQNNDGFVQRDTAAKAQGSAPAQGPSITGGVIAQGRFVADAHRTQGIALLLKTSNSTLLVFNGFGVEAGPGLVVYLSRSTDPAGAISLGPLSAGAGDQSYTVPANADPAYRIVLIYSPGTNILFGHATMQ